MRLTALSALSLSSKMNRILINDEAETGVAAAEDLGIYN
jgi:hypothetical protein